MKKEIKFFEFKEEKKKVNLKKMVAANTIVLSTFIFFAFFGFYNFNSAKLSASVINSKKEDIKVEKLNKDSNNLKVFTSNHTKKYEKIVNKANPISEDEYQNYEIVNVENNLYSDVKLEKETYNQYLKLKESINQKGYYINIKSGFRTKEKSQEIFDSYSKMYGEDYANKYVALPGTSEHNLGLSFDFVISHYENGTKTNYLSDEYSYLENISYLYGFIIRYPKDKENITGYPYEPWHLRYVGLDLAKYLTKNNLTLEEYYQIED